MQYERILVTGGAGFIGSHVVRRLIQQGHEILCFDKLTYAGHPFNLDDVSATGKLQWKIADLKNSSELRSALLSFRPHAIIHLAAESHVDRSISSPSSFIESNVLSSISLADESLRFRDQLPAEKRDRFRIVSISTDEVFGSIASGEERQFTEDSPYAPNSPYAASKASADLILKSYRHTYGLPVAILYSSNNYGPFQHPEKFLPNSILHALKSCPIPVYGDGQNIRDWVHVSDHVDAILRLLMAPSELWEDYAIGDRPLSNLQMLKLIHNELVAAPENSAESHSALSDIAPFQPDTDPNFIRFVSDRPGHDFQYRVDSTKIRKKLGWSPRISLEVGIRELVQWYRTNERWIAKVRSKLK